MLLTIGLSKGFIKKADSKVVVKKTGMGKYGWVLVAIVYPPGLF